MTRLGLVAAAAALVLSLGLAGAASAAEQPTIIGKGLTAGQNMSVNNGAAISFTANGRTMLSERWAGLEIGAVGYTFRVEAASFGTIGNSNRGNSASAFVVGVLHPSAIVANNTVSSGVQRAGVIFPETGNVGLLGMALLITSICSVLLAVMTITTRVRGLVIVGIKYTAPNILAFARTMSAPKGSVLTPA